MQDARSQAHRSRGLQDRAYADFAIVALLGEDIEDESYTPLLPSFGSVIRGEAKLPWKLLTELGRLGDADEIRSILGQCVDKELSRSDAAAAIKRYRRGGMIPHDEDRLISMIHRSVASYCDTYELTDDQLLATLVELTERIERGIAHQDMTGATGH